jgi:hypothetical protein
LKSLVNYLYFITHILIFKIYGGYMYSKLFLIASMFLLPFNYAHTSGDHKGLVPVSEQKNAGSVPDENLVLTIVKKLHKGNPLDRDEVVFINTLCTSTLTFGILNGFYATSKFHLSAKESLYAAGIGAALGFIVGLPAAYFNASEWYD